MIKRKKLIIVVLTIAALMAWIALRPLHPSDQAMIKNFNKHRTAIEHLRVMADEDRKVVRIAQDFTWLEENLGWPRPESELGFSKQRWASYKAIFTETTINDGIFRTREFPNAIFFIVSVSGLVTGGSEKGYAYLNVPPSRIYDSLDAFPRDSKSNIPAFKHIDGNWFLYSMWDN